MLWRAGVLSEQSTADNNTLDTPRIRNLLKSFLALDDEDQELILKQMRALNALKTRRRSAPSTREAEN